MAIIRPQFNPIQLTTVQTALSNVWKEDNPFLADAPTIVNSSQIRRAANKAATEGDLNLFTGLNELVKSLEAGNRTLDTNGDGKLDDFPAQTTPTNPLQNIFQQIAQSFRFWWQCGFRSG